MATENGAGMVELLERELLARRIIGPLERRQALFFSERMPDARYRDDFRTLMLLLLALLRRGSPRARGGDLLSVPGVVPENGASRDYGGPVPVETAGVAAGLAAWFTRITGNEALDSMQPLVGIHPVAKGETSPLVVYDPEYGSFGFQAYHAAELLLADALKVRVHEKTQMLDVPRAAAVLDNAVRTSFAGKEPHLRQLAAAVVALARKFLIISGGPGTGKSAVLHLVVRAVVAYHDLPVEGVALCAPTGRAKTRLLDAVTRDLPENDPFRHISAHTIHSLLGSSADGKFRYTKEKKLPCRLLVVDEASMVDLQLFAALLDALHPECRLILAGDIDQLPPVNAGAVLGDLAAGAVSGTDRGTLSAAVVAETGAVLSAASPQWNNADLTDLHAKRPFPLADTILFLTHNYRSEKGIMQWWEDCAGSGRVRESGAPQAKITGAVDYIDYRCGQVADAADLAGRYCGEWISRWGGEGGVYRRWIGQVRPLLTENPTRDQETAAAAELRALIGQQRILCCVNEGILGCTAINNRCDTLFRSLKKENVRHGRWHDGMPVIVNRNQGGRLDLYNGDIGVVLEHEGRTLCCFPVRGAVVRVAIELVADISEAYAITVHKSQGSEFDEVMLMVPGAEALSVTRKMLYTAITRARRFARIVDPAGRCNHIDRLPVDKGYSLLADLFGK